MKPRLSIYNLNGKAARWWRDLKHTKKDELREIHWDTFEKFFQEKYMSKRFFDRKVKEFHELHMGSMTMDTFINIFLDMLHYVPYIKEEKEEHTLEASKGDNHSLSTDDSLSPRRKKQRSNDSLQGEFKKIRAPT